MDTEGNVSRGGKRVNEHKRDITIYRELLIIRKLHTAEEIEELSEQECEELFRSFREGAK